jgi:transposase-like protein
MSQEKKEKEIDIINQLLDNIDFRGLIQDEIKKQDGIIRQLTLRMLQRALVAEMAEHLGMKRTPAKGTTVGISETGTRKRTCCCGTSTQE